MNARAKQHKQSDFDKKKKKKRTTTKIVLSNGLFPIVKIACIRRDLCLHIVCNYLKPWLTMLSTPYGIRSICQPDDCLGAQQSIFFALDLERSSTPEERIRLILIIRHEYGHDACSLFRFRCSFLLLPVRMSQRTPEKTKIKRPTKTTTTTAKTKRNNEMRQRPRPETTQFSSKHKTRVKCF